MIEETSPPGDGGTSHRGSRKSIGKRAGSSFKRIAAAQQGRAGNSVVCVVCGAPLHPKRGSRRQLYCSYRCRDEARRARNFELLAVTRRGRPLIPRSVENNGIGSMACKAEFRDRAFRIRGPRVVIEAEIFAERNW
jgi:hypothetical protein